MGSELVAGQWVHEFHQSDLQSFSLCPERGRANYMGEVPRIESAAAAQGTGLHSAIEACLDEVMRGQGPLSAKSMLDIAMGEFQQIMKTPGASWGRVRSQDVAKQETTAIFQFLHEVLPGLDPIKTEVSFEEVELYADSDRTILLSGIIDLLDVRGLIDHKTAGRKYALWEKQRYDVQSTVYTYAARKLGLIPNTGKSKFQFHVYVKGGDFQLVEVERGPGHFAWLQHQTLALAMQLENTEGKGPWQLRDEGWHCSEAWCPKWATCKGSFVK